MVRFSTLGRLKGKGWLGPTERRKWASPAALSNLMSDLIANFVRIHPLVPLIPVAAGVWLLTAAARPNLPASSGAEVVHVPNPVRQETVADIPTAALAEPLSCAAPAPTALTAPPIVVSDDEAPVVATTPGETDGWQRWTWRHPSWQGPHWNRFGQHRFVLSEQANADASHGHDVVATARALSAKPDVSERTPAEHPVSSAKQHVAIDPVVLGGHPRTLDGFEKPAKRNTAERRRSATSLDWPSTPSTAS